MSTGKVYWVTGLSGAGKTTIGKLFYEKLKSKELNTVFLDGDTLRQIFGNDLGYSLDARKKSAMRNSRLCKELSEQGINVICATISMFDDCRLWNRENIKKYKEIYIRVPMEILVQRDQKKLYSRAISGEISNVMGIDIDFEEPKNPDLIIDNTGEYKPEILVEKIYNIFID